LSEAATVNQITLTTRGQVLDFLSARPDPDELITWTCPECHAVNSGTYHSHITRCGSCGRGHFPAIPLPIVGDAKISVKRAFMNDRLTQIADNITEAEDEIRSLESQIEDQGRYIRRWKEEQEDLKKELWLDRVSTGDA
jgi:hypothetical protein